MAKTRTNREEVMKETATSVAGADLDNSSVACFDCKVEFRHKEMFSESTYSLDIGAKDPNDNVSVCKQCFEAILEKRGGATMIPPDIGDLGHSDTRDRRRNYKYREYSINAVMDDGRSMDIRYLENTLANALAKAEMYATKCDYVVVVIQDGMLWWVPEHSDWQGKRVEGDWEWDTFDEIEGYHVRKGKSGITTERLAPKNWASAYSILFGHRPRTINRAALIVRPKGPFIDWANSVDDDGPRAILEELTTDPSIYLVETFDFLEDFDLLVDDTWEWIFREQLNGWMRDADLWPEGLTREMFLEWFDCELSTMIWDMLKPRIKPAF